MTLGWGLIGIGVLADTWIAPAIGKQRDSHLAAACSRELARAEAFAQRHGVERAYDSYADMLADAAVDIVYIATPNAVHKEQAIAALHAGKHVLIEKPMALSSADGREILAAASETGLLVGVAFQLRHKPTSIAARDALREKRVGRAFLAELTIGAGKGLYPYDTWRSDLQLAGGGTLLNQGTHVIDLLRFLTGREVVEVTCLRDSDRFEDVCTAMCRLDDGMLATLSAHQLYSGTRPEWMVAGEEGWLHGRGGTSPRGGDEVVLHTGGTQEQLATNPAPAYDAEIAAFAVAVKGEAPLNGSAEDGLRNIAVVEALYRASREGRTVRVGG
jgi:1,5-anhydro-D-fructose reductase (1,5-anhydro-D-mannitol-forming)